MNREISTITEGLNPAQRQAVEQFEGPSLIIAGAGSGKTKVLTCRIANILSNGHRAGSVLALTFTNKASREMKERISSLVGNEAAKYLWMGTFHSVFVRFLREDAELLGFPKSFTIYDTSDSRSAVRACIRDLSLDDKAYKPNEVLSRISMAKNNLVTAAAYTANATFMANDAAARKPKIGEIFALYEKRCRQSGAMDFDDILLYTNILLRDFPEVLDKFRQRFSFILVDEYQDTNYAQYLIVKKLSSTHRNLCVVGDDAQSIYSFRGARIENILNFRKDYPEAKEFRLEQNYRSTQTIVKAANSLISKNSAQLKKECFSEAGVGDNIEIVKAYTDQEEAFLVASSILSKIYDTKAAYSDFAVLYRTNAQSRAVEEALRKRSLPYKIYGGNSFYDRAEVKDVMAYLRLLVNPKDDEAFRRVVNVPGRGIGDTTVGYLSSAAVAGGMSMWEALFTGDVLSFGIKSAALHKLTEFCKMVSEVAAKIGEMNAYDIAVEIFIKSGYATMIKGDLSIEGQAKAENVEELFNSIKAFVEEREAEAEAEAGVESVSVNEKVDKTKAGTNDAGIIDADTIDSGAIDAEDSELYGNENIESEAVNGENFAPVAPLEDYLETISLMSAIDENSKEEDFNKISLMTVHSAKGLEFPHVYVIGLEENLFPSVNSSSSESEIEEERRLMYVAITRAKTSVTLSYAHTRFRWGNHVNYPPSRFLKEIDAKFVNWPELDKETGGTDLEQQLFGNRSFGNKGFGNRGNSEGNYGNKGFGNRGSSEGNYGNKGFGNRASSGGNSSQPPQVSRPKPNFTPPKAPNPNFIADPVSKLVAGQTVEHDRFGVGQLLVIEGDPLNLKAVVDFNDGGRKILLLKYAKLRVIS
jgi:DNA helicase-2/ATP-dependent DNA helicase PcrA